MQHKAANYKRVLRKLARKNALLRRRVAFIEEQRIKQENLSENRRSLLRRINEEYAAVQQLLQHKNRELAAFTEQLSRSQRELAGVLEHSPCCIAVKTPTGVYTMCNAQLEDMLGLARGQGAGKTVRQLYQSEDADKLEILAREVLHSRTRATRELQLWMGSSLRQMRVTMFPLLDDAGAVQALGSIAIDMTELRRMESETLHAAQLASIGELAAGVAHEINNPVNGIMNYAQLLADELEEVGLTREYPGLIIQESERIAGIVRSLLDLARKPRHVRAPCDLGEILNDSLRLVRRQLLHENITLQVDLAAQLPAVHGNPLELQQVFMNCISNARKAMQDAEGAKIEKILHIQACPHEEGRVQVSFEDNGAGISPDNLKRIFDPFFTTDGEGRSTGLGLSICRRIVVEHGGEMHALSEPGQHTRIMVVLPALASEASDNQPDTLHRQEKGPEKTR